MLTYKYRIYPTLQQKQQLERYFGCCRYVYNYMLNYKQKLYEQEHKSCSFFDLNKKLIELKKDENTQFLLEAPAQSLNEINRNLIEAFNQFYKNVKNGKSPGYPKFKSKKNEQSIVFPQGNKILENKYIQVFKLGKIKCKFHREFMGNIRRMIITKTIDGKYYVSILSDYSLGKSNNEKLVGIDMGLKKFIVTSDNKTYDNPKFLRKSQKRLSRLQRWYSRKQKGSRNKEKFRLIVAKGYTKVKNQRLDYLHKISRSIANQYGYVAVEKLGIQDMMKNKYLSYSIGDSGWNIFKQLLKYKTNIIELDRYEPSSKKCSNCGHIKKELKLRDRIYKCSKCGLIIDRDLNAAINIKNIGLKQLNCKVGTIGTV